MKWLIIFLFSILPSFISAQYFEYDYLTRQLKLFSPTDSIPSIHFRNTTTTADWILKHDGIKFHIQNETNSGHERLTIQSNGNIGIGTTSPENELHVVGKAKVTEMDTVTSATANVVRQGDGTLAVRQYKIGDLVHGGIVFWVDETGEHGLEAATADQSNNAAWGLLSNVTGAIRDNIYSGMMNTERIIISQGNNAFAADLCAQYAGGGYGDWYLPSKEELNLMWKNLHRFGCPLDSSPCPTALGGFSDDDYWSSTEVGDDYAWDQGFDDGDQCFNDKDFNRPVRAVRAF